MICENFHSWKKNLDDFIVQIIFVAFEMFIFFNFMSKYLFAWNIFNENFENDGIYFKAEKIECLTIETHRRSSLFLFNLRFSSLFVVFSGIFNPPFNGFQKNQYFMVCLPLIGEILGEIIYLCNVCSLLENKYSRELSRHG